MRTARFSIVAAAVVLAAAVVNASAQDASGISVTSVDRAVLGERFSVTIEARTATGVQVEVDPAAPSWATIEVLEVSVEQPRSVDGGLVHRITVTAASFALGAVEVRPRLLFIADGLLTPHEAPVFTIEIASSLPPGAPLELSSLPQPQTVSGQSRSWTTPLTIGAAVVGGFVLLCALVALLRHRPRRVQRTPSVPIPLSATTSVALPDEDDAMADPVAAYRSLGVSVRKALADRYSLPAQALTTGELGRRMEAEGVDRWQARLVRGLLENCDAVVYAGYLPAPDRRRADLNIAREIVEGSA